MRTREFKEWLYEPSFEESVCANPFHDIAKKVFFYGPVPAGS